MVAPVSKVLSLDSDRPPSPSRRARRWGLGAGGGRQERSPLLSRARTLEGVRLPHPINAHSEGWGLRDSRHS